MSSQEAEAVTDDPMTLCVEVDAAPHQVFIYVVLIACVHYIMDYTLRRLMKTYRSRRQQT